MTKIIIKITTALAAVLIVMLVGALLGFVIAYLCQIFSPGLTEAILESLHVTIPHQGKAAVSIAYAIFFGPAAAFSFSIVAIASLLLPTAIEMRRQMLTATKIISLALVITMVGTVAYASLSTGRILGLEIMMRVITSGDLKEQFRLGVYMAHSAFAGLFIGILLAVVNLIRFMRTNRTLDDYLLNGDSTLAKVVSLAYPFNGLKTVLITVTVITLGWQLLLSTDGSYLRLIIFTYASPMWAIAAGYLYEFAVTKAGRNSPYMSEFYEEISDDIYVLVVFSLSVLVFYWRLPTPYAWTNLDLGLLAPPYFLYVLLTLYRCGKAKVAGHRLSQSFVNTLIGGIAVIYFSAFYAFYRIQTEKISAIESLWWQTTMFTTSVATFIGARLLLFYLRKGRLEGSPIWLEAIRTVKISSGIYEKLVASTPEWNMRVEKENARLRKEKREQIKRKRK